MWSSYTRCWSWTCIREKEAEIYLLFDIWLLNDCAEWKIHIPACLADTGTATVTDTQHKSCLPWTAALYQLSKKQHQGASRALEPIPLMMFFRCDSAYPCRWVSGSVMFSDFEDSYRIYRACELVEFSAWYTRKYLSMNGIYIPSHSASQATAPRLIGVIPVLRQPLPTQRIYSATYSL